ncbi:MAG: ABC transporter ATP-binding protein [Polyangiaceae bacterium]|nr:ABC transporter ATP-binding protein [Polyangiaceae bacterium]
MPNDFVLEVKDLKTSFFVDGVELKAVDGASFQVRRGRVVAIVGESGCGKSVSAYSILRLVKPPGRIVGGRILIHPHSDSTIDITALSEDSDKLYALRGGTVGMIFQEPMTALSPVHTVGNQLAEAIRLHRRQSTQAIDREAATLLGKVGIAAPEQALKKYPHELSGGMRQRVVIAIALANSPELVIADEPTTALDVTLQAQILGLLKSLKREHNLSVLLITHDLGVVAQTADDIVLMYLGRVVEAGPLREVLRNPQHPYTRGLLDSIPSRSERGKPLPSIEGNVPSLKEIPPGCPFHPRCRYAVPGRCDQGLPPPTLALNAEHTVACLRMGEL